MAPSDPGTARWDDLRRLAELQGGFFTLQQADGCGISRQLLRHHALRGRVVRVFSRIYRLLEVPAGVGRWIVPWLWSRGAGTFSHQSALELHGLAGTGEGPVHLTVPLDWSPDRRVPPGVILHRAELCPHERSWVHGLAVTSPERTRQDLGWSGVVPP